MFNSFNLPLYTIIAMKVLSYCYSKYNECWISVVFWMQHFFPLSFCFIYIWIEIWFVWDFVLWMAWIHVFKPNKNDTLNSDIALILYVCFSSNWCNPISIIRWGGNRKNKSKLDFNEIERIEWLEWRVNTIQPITKKKGKHEKDTNFDIYNIFINEMCV